MIVNGKEYESTLCPCYGKEETTAFMVCSVCGWSNDFMQAEHPDMTGGDNKMSLNQAKIAYAEGRRVI